MTRQEIIDSWPKPPWFAWVIWLLVFLGSGMAWGAGLYGEKVALVVSVTLSMFPYFFWIYPRHVLQPVPMPESDSKKRSESRGIGAPAGGPRS